MGFGGFHHLPQRIRGETDIGVQKQRVAVATARPRADVAAATVSHVFGILNQLDRKILTDGRDVIVVILGIVDRDDFDFMADRAAENRIQTTPEFCSGMKADHNDRQHFLKPFSGQRS